MCWFAICLIGALPNFAKSHTIVVDGAIDDWIDEVPPAFNQGMLVRNTNGHGELVFLDLGRDSRTDLNDPELQADIAHAAITSDRDSLYIRLRVNETIDLNAAEPVQFQIAIDVDGVDGSGQEHFAGFADTTTSERARWEWLLQTQVESGVMSARLWRSDFVVMGDADPQVAVGGWHVEFAIPWDDLVNIGQPANRVRLTIATFREGSDGNTVPIGDASVPNALDVLSDYDQPGVRLNTWAEFAGPPTELRVDHYLEAYFERDGDVMVPVVFHRLHAHHHPAGGTFVEVVRATTVPVWAGDYMVGDATQVGATLEAMVQLPDEPMRFLPYRIARNASHVQEVLGILPDYEIEDSLLGVPELELVPEFGSGLLHFGSSDQVVILGPHRLIVDSLSYSDAPPTGFGSTLGGVPIPGIIRRVDIEQDTDVMHLDYVAFAACRDIRDCAPCHTCRNQVCNPVPVNTGCEDGDLCTEGEQCDENAQCVPTEIVECDDADPCAVGSCDPDVGCVSEPAPPGTLCGDEDPCNGVDVCVDGLCLAGPPALECLDGGVPDSGPDAGGPDAGSIDASTPADGGGLDGASPDSALGDASATDGNQSDGEMPDTGIADAGIRPSDAGADRGDAGSPATERDASSPMRSDATQTDAMFERDVMHSDAGMDAITIPSGSCSCHTAPARSGLAEMVLAIGFVFRRRRR